jgi:2-hydroxy-4-(methylsulfanyl)butanoate S-methyltransferase
MNTPRAKQIEEVHEILAITYGFMASKALFAALEFDLFTHIAGGAGSFPELAKATGIAENRLVTLLTALKSLGLIAERQGHFTKCAGDGAVSGCGSTGRFQSLC